MCAGISIFFGNDIFWGGGVFDSQHQRKNKWCAWCLQLMFHYEIKLTFLVRGSRKPFSILQNKVNV